MEITGNELLKSSNVDVILNTSFEEKCMHFIFKAKFTKEASILATKAWSKEFDSNPDSTYTHIWDCTNMQDFEYGARDEWMEALSNYSDQIDHVSIVASSVMIRGAARVMSKFSKLDLRVYKSFEELNQIA